MYICTYIYVYIHTHVLYPKTASSELPSPPPKESYLGSGGPCGDQGAQLLPDDIRPELAKRMCTMNSITPMVFIYEVHHQQEYPNKAELGSKYHQDSIMFGYLDPPGSITMIFVGSYNEPPIEKLWETYQNDGL